MMRKLACLVALAGLTAMVHAADYPQLKLELAQAEQLALDHSQTLKAKIMDMEAAQAHADSRFSLFWPSVAIEGRLNYAAKVPTLELNLPHVGAMSLPFGDHTNYSIGAVASWNLWDSGQNAYQWKASQHAVEAKKLEVVLAKQQVLLETRLAYFKVQLSLEQARLLQDALRVNQSQYEDIEHKHLAGTASQADSLASHLQVLDSVTALENARTMLSDNIRDLLNLTGQVEDYDVTYPMAPDQLRGQSGQIQKPTVVIDFDSLQTSLAVFTPAGQAPLDNHHPQSKFFEELAGMARQAALGIDSNHWPTVQLSARTGLEYPNGPVNENVYQNRAGVKAQWLLFKGMQITHLEQEQTIQAQQYEHQLKQAKINMKLQWMKARAQWHLQLQQEQTLVQAVKETERLARLTYQAYLAGQVDYIKVQAANLQVLQTKTKKVQAQVQQLMQLAILDSLAPKKVRETTNEAQTR